MRLELTRDGWQWSEDALRFGAGLLGWSAIRRHILLGVKGAAGGRFVVLLGATPTGWNVFLVLDRWSEGRGGFGGGLVLWSDRRSGFARIVRFSGWVNPVVVLSVAFRLFFRFFVLASAVVVGVVAGGVFRVGNFSAGFVVEGVVLVRFVLL